MLARDLMTRNPAVCTPETTLSSAARMMVEFHCGAIPVVESFESNRLIGIVTDRDLVCRALARDAGPQTAVRECMTPNPIAVSPTATLEACCAQMESRQVRRIPVVDSEGRIMGIIAQADVAEKAPAPLAASVIGQISRHTLEASRPMAVAA